MHAAANANSGLIVYILLALLAVMFWRAWGRRPLDELFAAGTHLHHQVLAVMAKHPQGGDWASHQRWMAEAEHHH